MTPLFSKLNLGTNNTLLVLNAPESFESELAQLSGVKVIRKGTAKTLTKFAIGFAITLSELEQVSKLLAMSTEGDAVVWVAYPKGTSKKYQCEFNRDNDWSALGNAGFEPVRQVAIDEDWSALRFRRADYIESLKRHSEMAISAEGKRRARK